MGYVGQAPNTAILTAADITDGIIANVDIASDAAIAMSKTTLSAGTGLTLSTNTLNVDASQTGITAVGTISTGTWEGDTVAVNQGGTGATSLTNLFALGTHTTGNYMTDVSAGTLVDVTHTPGEGSTATVNVDLTEAAEGAIANGDYILFLDGGATGTQSKEAVHDLATLFAGTGLTASSSVIGVDAAQTGITSLGTQAADFIVGNGYGIVVGHSSQVAVGGQTPEFQILGTGWEDSRWSAGLWKNDAIGGRGYFTKSRNATIGSSTIVQDDDEIGMLVFTADDGVDFVSEAARIGVFVDGTPGENDMPGRIVLSTTADGAASPTEALRINSSQHVRIAERLVIDGNNGILFEDAGKWGISYGTQVAGWATVGDGTTYNGVSIYPGSALYTNFPADGTIQPEYQGAVGTPTYTFQDDPNTGMYQEGADQLSFAVGGARHLNMVGGSEIVFNDGQTDLNFRIESNSEAYAFAMDANLRSSAVGIFSLGWSAGPTKDVHFFVDDDHVITDNANYFGVNTQESVAKASAEFVAYANGMKGRAMVGATNTQNWTGTVGLRGVIADAGTTAGGSGTITGVASFYAGSIWASGASITNTYAMYMLLATAGTNDYYFGFGTADNTDPTSGGGAATGRLKVEVGGVARYIPYY